MVEKEEHSLLVIEDLPNELFREIFSYLTGIDSVYGFSLLNTRFQCLLKEYCLGFDFKLIDKTKFDIIFGQYNKQWWKSLRLSNEDISSEIEYFFENYSLIDDISQLKYLSLIKMTFIDQSNLVYQLSCLTNLVSLTLKPICGQMMYNIHLPKLKRLVVSSCKNTEWVKIFPQLERLEYEIVMCCSEQTNFIWPSQLKHLKIILKNDTKGKSLLRSLRHLSELMILEIYQKELGRFFFDGQYWERLICSSFPLLKKFQFYFQFFYSFTSTDEIKRIMSTFSTPFYTIEKKWSIRCDVINHYGKGIIYSLPFNFHRFTIFRDFFDTQLLTLSNKNFNKIHFRNVKTLIIESLSEWNIEILKTNEHSFLSLIYKNYFNSVQRFRLLPNFYSNDIKIPLDNFYCLLKHFPRLYALEIQINDLHVLMNNINISNYLSEKIQSLELYPDSLRDPDFNQDKFNQIKRVFATKCQHLSIYILSTIDQVISLLRDMQYLHSLHIFIQIKNHADITIKWLEKQQIGLNSFNCYIINDKHKYYFWIQRN